MSKRKTASTSSEESLYQLMLNDISTGELEGGQRLKVTDLAQRYGVSPSPVREVLRRMQGEGFVIINQNRGAVVQKADAHMIQNVFEILQLLEPYFVSWFAEFSDPEMIEHLEEIQAEIERAGIEDINRFRQLDLDFHWAICEHHYNSQAKQMWRNFRRALNAYGAKLTIKPNRFQAIVQEHRELISAFKMYDVEEANAVINRHVKGSFNQMSQQMRSMT